MNSREGTQIEQSAPMQRLRSEFPAALLALLFLLLPLYRAPVLEDSFITPKVALTHLVVLLVTCAAWIRTLRGRLTTAALSATALAFTAFWAMNLISITWASSGALALYATAYFTTFTLLFFACMLLLRDELDIRIVLNAGILAAPITAIWTLIEDFTRGSGFGGISPRLPDWRGYLAAGLGNSGHIAGFISLFLPAAIILFLGARRFRWGLFAAITLMFGAVAVTWSIGSTAALLISLAIWCVIALSAAARRHLHWGRVLFLLAAGAAVSFFFLLPHPLNPHQPSLWHEAFGSERWKEGGATRVAIWKTTLHMISQSPIFGVGAGNFTFEYVRQIVPGLISDPNLRLYAGSFTNDAHNEYLQVWSELGTFGLVFYLFIFIAFFVRLTTLFRRAEPQQQLLLISAGAGVTVFLLDSMMTFPLRLPAHFAATAFFLTVPEILSKQVTAVRHASPVVLSGTGARGLATILLVLALAASPIYLRRVMAEHHMKRARQVAESGMLVMNGQIVSTWHAAEQAFRNGAQMLAAGDRDGARAAFNAAKEIARHESIAKAENRFIRALAWDPHYSNASSRFGALLLMRGDYEEAAKVLWLALTDLQAYEVHERLGFAYYFLGRIKDANDQWSYCREHRPILAPYYSSLIRQTQTPLDAP